MGCARCGGGKRRSQRCCLCGSTSYMKKYKWGNKRIICSKCKKKQQELMIENENMAIRTRTLLAGKDFSWQELEKWKKHWYAKSVEKL